MFHIDCTSKTPVYEQLMNNIKNLVLSGVLKPHERLPSVRSVALELAINPNTVQKAYQFLELEGILYSQAGKGSFVSPETDDMRERQIRSLREELSRLCEKMLTAGVSPDKIIEMTTTIVKKEETT